jgi:hypothetical protein
VVPGLPASGEDSERCEKKVNYKFIYLKCVSRFSIHAKVVKKNYANRYRPSGSTSSELTATGVDSTKKYKKITSDKCL